jgi:hypothetical protein
MLSSWLSAQFVPTDSDILEFQNVETAIRILHHHPRNEREAVRSHDPSLLLRGMQAYSGLGRKIAMETSFPVAAPSCSSDSPNLPKCNFTRIERQPDWVSSWSDTLSLYRFFYRCKQCVNFFLMCKPCPVLLKCSQKYICEMK